MNGQIKTNKSVFTLPNMLNLGAAEELRENFIQQLVVGTDINIDASNVDTITTPCLQVLISAGRSFEEVGNKVSIQNPTVAVVAAFEDLGLIEYFEKWSMK